MKMLLFLICLVFSPSKNAAESITFETVKQFPRKVAILINRDTVSSGELFVLMARQSRKVTVYGENSAGMIDYGDVLSYETVSPSIKPGVPFTRFNWLDEGVSVDKQGLLPDRIIPEKVKNWIRFAYLSEVKTKPQ